MTNDQVIQLQAHMIREFCKELGVVLPDLDMNLPDNELVRQFFAASKEESSE